MQWELGYFDSLKNRVAILPILKEDISTDEYKGREYLGLYPYVTDSFVLFISDEKDKNIDVPIKNDDTVGERIFLIHESTTKYIDFRKWLKGSLPYEH